MAAYDFSISLLCSDATVIIEGISQERKVIDIGETVEKHKAIASQLLAMHAIMGNDTGTTVWHRKSNSAQDPPGWPFSATAW